PPIQITDPQTIRSISVSENGKVYIERKVGNNYSLEEVGQIFLYKFINPAGLKSIGNNLFVESPASGPAIEGTPGNDGFGKIIQGKLERANVNIVEEMVNLIVAQRAYEMNSKGVQASDEMLREAATLKR
ncbi:MAG TPA: flagellar hook-basal body complex protein, partial [Aquificae bacterium]|nr:flagellar hook-basal body complex protein [Aquificota bacterium]